MIGGTGNLGRIDEFKDNIWRQHGTLARGRMEHGSISLGDEVMVIGGWSGDST